jgi:beta-mannosidase
LINNSDRDSVQLPITIEGKNFKSEPLNEEFSQSLASDQLHIEMEFELENPLLWFPWDQGTPNLYSLILAIVGEGMILDEFSGTFGIRDFQLISQNIDPKYYPWIFEINGIKEYIRGGNWVPSDMLFGQIDEERYRKNIRLIKEANLNLVRVWGGGLIEKDAFYQVCDEEGILVWQEFPIACVFTNTLPKNERYLTILKNEAESIVKTCRNHPSLLLWCGGNEFHSGSNDYIIKILNEAVKNYDERIFIPASPEGGDSHNYSVFHGMGTYSLYLEDNAPIASEFGLSSFPNYSTLQKYVPAEELHFWSSTINYRAPHVIFFQGHKMRNQLYAIPFSPSDELESIIKATQQAQGLGLKIAIEHYRRRKLNWQNAGCAFWQINSPWPCISWCIFEYDYEKKLSFEYVRVAYQPLLVSLNYNLDLNYNEKNKDGTLNNRNFEADIFLINDFPEHFSNCTLAISFLTQKNMILHTIDRTIDIPENTCVKLESVSYEFPKDLEYPPKIRIKLLSNDQTLSKNFYNLRYYDPVHSKRMGRLMKRSSDILMYDQSSRAVRLLKTGGLALRIIPLFIYLACKTKIKWRRRGKDEFEYESTDFLQSN